MFVIFIVIPTFTEYIFHKHKLNYYLDNIVCVECRKTMPRNKKYAYHYSLLDQYKHIVSEQIVWYKMTGKVILTGELIDCKRKIRETSEDVFPNMFFYTVYSEIIK